MVSFGYMKVQNFNSQNKYLDVRKNRTSENNVTDIGVGTKGGKSKMKEILTMGNITEDFNRLGIIVRQTYKGEDYGVCEVTEKEFKILCNEADTDKAWEHAGWNYSEGSNQGEPTIALLINHHNLICWYESIDTEDEETYIPQYVSLLEYLCDAMGCSQPRNVCALTKDLAKYNGIKLSELFKIYQG